MRRLFIIVISALILSVGGVLVLHEAKAQVECASETEAALCGPNLHCIGGPDGSQRCNMPPPIWNVAGTGLATSGQNAMIYLSGIGAANSARFGNLQIGLGNQINNVADTGSKELAVNFNSGGLGFTVYDGANQSWFRVNNVGLVRVARGLSIGNSAPDASNNNLEVAGDVIVRGNIVLPTAGRTVDGVNLDNAVTTITTANGSGLVLNSPGNVGHGRNLSLRNCTVTGQVLQWNHTTSAWACATITGGGGVSAHSALSGLLNNDHTQYYLQTGDTRNLNVGGNLSIGGELSAGTVPWARLSAFPSVCPDGQYVSGIGATLTCGTPTGNGGDSGGVGGSGAANKLAFWTGTNILDQNTNLHWDNIAEELGIGVTDPEFTLDVSGDRIMMRNPGGNAELDLQSRDPDLPPDQEPQHWGLFADRDSRDLRFWYGTERFFFSSTGDFVAMNSINANGCFGPVFVGLTAAVNGNNNNQAGYQNADIVCNGAFGGSHVCTVAEILNSKSCDSATYVARINGSGWVLSGPPGFSATANDCIGRTSALAGDLGSYWVFNNQGGQGWVSPCHMSYPLACCR